MFYNDDKKYDAVWLSYSSINDFLKCPRLYYLSNVYKDPATGHKINLIKPPLALGQAVHQTLESLSTLSAKKRFNKPLMDKFYKVWEKFFGSKGGFRDAQQEEEYKNRGEVMINRVMDNHGPLANKAVKIKTENGLPYYWFSKKDNIILCGKIDWLEYIKDDNSVHLIDFKTGKLKEDSDSLQLPIYHLLADQCQARRVSKASYWYLNIHNKPGEVELLDLEESHKKIFRIALKIKDARKKKAFQCPKGGCFHCGEYEKIIKGEARKVGVGFYNKDVYIL